MLIFLYYPETSRGAAAQSVPLKPTGCGFDPHSRKWNIYLNLYFYFFAPVSRQSAALSSATQHAMLPKLGRKRGTECLNTKFPLPTLLCASCCWFFFILSNIETATIVSATNNITTDICLIQGFWDHRNRFIDVCQNLSS